MPGRSASSWHRSLSMPAGPTGGSGAGAHAPRRAVSASAISGRGRASRASRSAAAGASRPVWWRTTRLPLKDADASRDHRRARTGPGPRWPLGCQPGPDCRRSGSRRDGAPGEPDRRRGIRRHLTMAAPDVVEPGQRGLVYRVVAGRAGNDHLTPATRVNVSQPTAENLTRPPEARPGPPTGTAVSPRPRPNAEPTAQAWRRLAQPRRCGTAVTVAHWWVRLMVPSGPRYGRKPVGWPPASS